MKIGNLLSQLTLTGLILAFAGDVLAENVNIEHKTKPAEVTTPPNTGKTNSASEKTISAEELYKISPDDVVLGDSKAKVTIIEYASMTCSHCSDFHKNTYPEIKTKYIDTGKVKFIFRPFPLDEAALRASMLASCAGKDRFYKFIDVLFTTQANWAPNKNYLEILTNIGKLGGLSGEDFDKCMADNNVVDKIMQGKLNASQVLNVRSTPSFFVNGNIYKGAHNFEYFSKVIDDALEEKSKDTSAATVTVPPRKPQGK